MVTEELQSMFFTILLFAALQNSSSIRFSFVGCSEVIREENLPNEACNNLAVGLDGEERSSSGQEQSNASSAMPFVTSKLVPVALKGMFHTSEI